MKRFRSIRNYANEKKIHDDNHKKIIFFICRARTEHLNLSEKISKNSGAYFHFSKKALEIWPEVLFKGNIWSKESIN